MRPGISISITPPTIDRLRALVIGRITPQKHDWRAQIDCSAPRTYINGSLRRLRQPRHGRRPFRPQSPRRSRPVASPAVAVQRRRPKELLRRQPLAPRDSGNLLPALVAFGKDLRPLRRGPRSASQGAGKHLKPTHRLRLGSEQKLSVRHVSNPLDSEGLKVRHSRIAHGAEVGLRRRPRIIAPRSNVWARCCSSILDGRNRALC